MEEDKMYATDGYHGTSSRWYNCIKELGFDPEKVKRRNDHWLGQGVYYFSDYSKALWWANDQANKPYNLGTYPLVYKSQISAPKEEILNLDNGDELDKFYDFVIQSLSEIENAEKYPVFDEKQMRAVYFDFYKIENNISVIIKTFDKPTTKSAKSRSKDELRKITSLANNLGLGYKETQICVSKKQCIISTNLVYNGEYEVI